MKILVMDMGSRVNMIGGQAKVASMLYNGLKKYFDTYYLGYETEYMHKENNAIILKRSKRLGLSLRQSKLSENALLRFGYNLVVVRGMRNLGIDKAELVERIRKISPDVIIANSMQDIVVLRYLRSKGIRFKCIYIDHGSLSTSTTSGYFSREGVPLTVGSGLTARSVKEAKSKFLNFFDMDIAINNEQLRKMEEITDKTMYIPNGLAVQSKGKGNLGKKYGIEKRDFVVLYVGRMFERQKNVSTLIRAFMNTDEKDMKLLLIGEGPSLQEYMELAKDDKRIIFANRVDEKLMPQVYELADLFVLPSFWEGFSITMLEAAAHSLPIILSENAYIGDLKADEIGKLISFNTYDEKELRNKIMLVYKSKRARASAIKVSKRISDKFSEKEMMLKYRDLIQRLSGMIA